MFKRPQVAALPVPDDPYQDLPQTLTLIGELRVDLEASEIEGMHLRSVCLRFHDRAGRLAEIKWTCFHTKNLVRIDPFVPFHRKIVEVGVTGLKCGDAYRIKNGTPIRALTCEYMVLHFPRPEIQSTLSSDEQDVFQSSETL